MLYRDRDHRSEQAFTLDVLACEILETAQDSRCGGSAKPHGRGFLTDKWLDTAGGSSCAPIGKRPLSYFEVKNNGSNPVSKEAGKKREPYRIDGR